MKKLVEKILTVSDKTVVTVSLMVATLIMIWTLATVEELTLEVVVMVALYAWLIVEAVTFEED